MALIACIGDNPLADAFAKGVAEDLVTAYPNHGWWVECKGGVLIIKHLEASGARGLVGMLRKMDTLSQDAMVRKKEVLKAAGELLERAYMPRGGRTQDPVSKFDLAGEIPEKYWKAPRIILH